MKNENTSEVVHGFKVFKPDWTCSPSGNTKQYTCPGRFEEEGKLDIYIHGMHFCENASDCFNYYKFDSNNKVAEVIAYGQVLRIDDICCTDKLEIVREIPWDEVLRIVNTGKDCTGFGNTGDGNTGNKNTGDKNIGGCNTGNRNAGYCNTGDRNTGYYNTGNCNTGDKNTGDWNTGDCNTGECNTGDYNSGDWNTGDYNTGDWNKSSFNNGCFNTIEPKIMLFNKLSDWTFSDWLNSEVRCLLNQIPKNVLDWVWSEYMTDKEKATHPKHEITDGYLKVLDESECTQNWWNGLDETDKNIIKSLPNFDPEIFKEITGIDVNLSE